MNSSIHDDKQVESTCSASRAELFVDPVFYKGRSLQVMAREPRLLALICHLEMRAARPEDRYPKFGIDMLRPLSFAHLSSAETFFQQYQLILTVSMIVGHGILAAGRLHLLSSYRH